MNIKNSQIPIHTDGLISKNELSIKTGDELGALKFEGKADNIEIYNLNKINAEFLV